MPSVKSIWLSHLRDKLAPSSVGTQDVHYDILQKTQRLFESVWSKGDERVAKELIAEDCKIFECETFVKKGVNLFIIFGAIRVMKWKIGCFLFLFQK
jgi:hypothetical protein